MKISFKSIRWRIQLWHGLLLLLVLAAFGIRSYYLARENRFSVIDQDLRHQSILVLVAMPDSPARRDIETALRAAFIGVPLHGLQQALRLSQNSSELHKFPASVPLRHLLETEVQTLSKTGVYYTMWNTNGAILFHSDNAPGLIPKPQATGKPGFHSRTRGELREEFISTARGFELLVGRPIRDDLASLHRVAIHMVMAGCIIMALGLAGGWWLSRRAVSSIKDISNTAEKIASGNFTERINISCTDNELGGLAKVLNTSFDRLQAALDRQSQFTADASHELRTPLSVMLAKTNAALARERTPAEYRSALESCRNATRRMSQLAESLLTLARLDSGEEVGKREPCQLELVAREAVELLRPLAEANGIKVNTEFEDAACLGDTEQLGQVVTNLVSNAIQYNRLGGEVWVKVKSERQTTFLIVSDTGQGISAENLPHIFERFYRADKSRSSADGHVGLGLAIAKAIIEAHGGTIHVSSEFGCGSTFTIHLVSA